ncbi:hypothetical protein N0V90_006643 [Kalmusia sp. IMI 367209]|nr:hypothetical protein N0V90_006643 [Kalmusia sp. IMI 367209]
MSEHGAKRQRLTGSFSPASPPYHIAAKSSETKTPIVHPNTPTSPPYPPMSSQPNGGPAMTAPVALSEMTPPSSVHMSQQVSQSGPSATNIHPFSTPASTAAFSNSINVDSDGDALMEESQSDDAVRLGGHRLTNHNRQNKSIFDDTGVAAAKGVCGSKLFKLCQSTHEPSRPHASQNLFELYGLNNLAKTVARQDPITGEKINKLRKSYEELHNYPDMDYHASFVAGKDMHRALNADQTSLMPDISSLLNSALGGMAPGPLPTQDSARYRAYLATDDPTKSKTPAEGTMHRAVQSASATPNPYAASAASRLSRPERTGAKRQYTDASFHGYGEGYEDFGESTGGEDNGSIKRRKLASFERTSHQVEVGGARR